MEISSSIDPGMVDNAAALGRANITDVVFSVEMETKMVDGVPETVPVEYVTFTPHLKLRGIFDCKKRVDEALNPPKIKMPGELVATTKNAVATAIRQYYTAWKASTEIDVVGTPLAAWTQIPESYRAHLRGAGFQSVEQLADATDSELGTVRSIPGIRKIQEAAQKYVLAKDTNKAAMSIAVKDEVIADQGRKIAAQEVRMAEMMAMMEELMSAKLKDVAADMDDAPKRRGRPPKARDDLVAEDAA